MLNKLLTALQGYFANTDDPTPGSANLGTPDLPLRDDNRLFRIFARALVELAQVVRGTNQQVQQNTTDIAEIKAKLGL